MTGAEIAAAAVGGLALLAVFAIAVPTVLYDAPPWPSGRAGRAAMATLLPAVPPAGTVVEIGSGWGGVLVALARRWPDRPIVGLEVSPLPWAVARLRLAVRANVRVRWADAAKADLSGVGLAVCYMTPKAMARLAPKLTAELPPGAVVISLMCRMPGWRAEAEATAKDMHRTPVYRYVVPKGERLT